MSEYPTVAVALAQERARALAAEAALQVLASRAETDPVAGSALSSKQDAGTAATDAELASAVATLNAALVSIESGAAWAGLASRPAGATWGLFVGDTGLFWALAGTGTAPPPVTSSSVLLETGDTLVTELNDLLLLEA